MSSSDLNFAHLFKDIVSYLDEGIILADNLGNILYHNPAVNKLLGINNKKPLISILFNWWKTNGDNLRKVISEG